MSRAVHTSAPVAVRPLPRPMLPSVIHASAPVEVRPLPRRKRSRVVEVLTLAAVVIAFTVATLTITAAANPAACVRR